MPRYDEIPVAIAQRLLGFDYMSEKPAEQEAAADREYPSEEINKLSAEARRLIRDLEPYWPRHTVADAFGEQPTAGESEKKGGDKADAMPPWVEKAEDFVAIQAIIFLSQHFILLRTMALSLVWVSVFLLLAATIYPFQPEQLILYLLLGLLGCVVGVVFWVLVRVNKNEIVGRITRSTPNRFELNGAFFQAAVRFIGPIAIIVAAQLSGRLRAIVEPLLEVIK